MNFYINYSSNINKIIYMTYTELNQMSNQDINIIYI